MDVVTGLTSFKIMLDIAKSIKDMSDASARYAAVIELQEKILSAQEAQSTLVQRIGNLEKEIAQFETWATEKQRYALTDYGGGTFACALKPEEARGEPPHRICANCYQHERKSILQTIGECSGQELVHCQSCDKTFGLGQKAKLSLPSGANTVGPSSWMR